MNEREYSYFQRLNHFFITLSVLSFTIFFFLSYIFLSSFVCAGFWLFFVYIVTMPWYDFGGSQPGMCFFFFNYHLPACRSFSFPSLMNKLSGCTNEWVFKWKINEAKPFQNGSARYGIWKKKKCNKNGKRKKVYWPTSFRSYSWKCSIVLWAYIWAPNPHPPAALFVSLLFVSFQDIFFFFALLFPMTKKKEYCHKSQLTIFKQCKIYFASARIK